MDGHLTAKGRGDSSNISSPGEMSPEENEHVNRFSDLKSALSRDKPIVEGELTQKRKGDSSVISTPDEDMSPSED